MPVIMTLLLLILLSSCQKEVETNNIEVKKNQGQKSLEDEYNLYVSNSISIPREDKFKKIG